MERIRGSEAMGRVRWCHFGNHSFAHYGSEDGERKGEEDGVWTHDLERFHEDQAGKGQDLEPRYSFADPPSNDRPGGCEYVTTLYANAGEPVLDETSFSVIFVLYGAQGVVGETGDVALIR
jgi:hypothetical protein